MRLISSVLEQIEMPHHYTCNEITQTMSLDTVPDAHTLIEAEKAASTKLSNGDARTVISNVHV